jgi:endonuclease/exonuclease/phosphatase family metal-dependent hydrolase
MAFSCSGWRVLLTSTAVALAGVLRAADQPLRVMTYNIHHGEGLDKRVDLERIAAVIKDAKADLVALQEVDRGVERTARRDLPAELAKLTGMTAVFENNFHYQGGEYGNAVLTSLPVKSKTNRHYKMLRTGEQRGLLQLVLDVRGREVLFMNTHIDYRADDSERLLNIDEIKGQVEAARNTPVILCGDFNDVPTSRTHAKAAEFLTDTWTAVGQGPGYSYPTEKPAKRIDYVWITPATIEPVRIAVLTTDASDHVPVLAELRLR